MENKSNVEMTQTPTVDPATTKRYSLSTDTKYNFYAIHHAEKKKRGRKRNTAVKKANPLRNKCRQKSNTYLYKTCHELWFNNDTMTLNYDYIKSLSVLLKVRLTQAKLSMIAQLDKDNELLSYLLEGYVFSKRKIPKIRICHESKSSNAVIGNSKNLFNRFYKLQKRISLPTLDTPEVTNKPSSKKKSKPVKKEPGKEATVVRRRRRSTHFQTMNLSDGRKVYVCKPCNKEYKTSNGLAYHMKRCKHKPPETTDEQQQLPLICIQNQISPPNSPALEDTFTSNTNPSQLIHVWEDFELLEPGTEDDDDNSTHWNMSDLPSLLFPADTTQHITPPENVSLFQNNTLTSKTNITEASWLELNQYPIQ